MRQTYQEICDIILIMVIFCHLFYIQFKHKIKEELEVPLLQLHINYPIMWVLNIIIKQHDFHWL